MQTHTLINRIKNVAAQPNTAFKMVVGHGGLIGNAARAFAKVPAGTYIIFLSKPGHLLAQASVVSNPQMRNHTYLRNVITNTLPRWAIQPVRLGMWKQHVYGPGNLYPDLSLNLYDVNKEGHRLTGSPFNRLAGLHTIKSNRPTQKHFYGQNVHLSNIVRFGGPGIYVVVACRASSERSWAGAMSAFKNNFRLTGGTQETLRRMGPTDPMLNRLAQRIENTQRRLVTYKRTATFPNNNPRPYKFYKMLTPFVGPSVFTPGVPSSRVRRPSRRPSRRASA